MNFAEINGIKHHTVHYPIALSKANRGSKSGVYMLHVERAEGGSRDVLGVYVLEALTHHLSVAHVFRIQKGFYTPSFMAQYKDEDQPFRLMIDGAGNWRPELSSPVRSSSIFLTSHNKRLKALRQLACEYSMSSPIGFEPWRILKDHFRDSSGFTIVHETPEFMIAKTLPTDELLRLGDQSFYLEIENLSDRTDIGAWFLKVVQVAAWQSNVDALANKIAKFISDTEMARLDRIEAEYSKIIDGINTHRSKRAKEECDAYIAQKSEEDSKTFIGRIKAWWTRLGT